MTDERTRVWIVADLGFGDSGKGTITDYLVRTRSAELVVRWNGGAQAGHTVVTEDGRAHVFSQLGAGTFVPGVRTHLAEPFVLHPTALLVEARLLAETGIPIEDTLARLTIAESALVITPFHQATNRLRELARGAARHGTCGVGVGETVRDALASGPDAIRARDLVGDRVTLLRKLSATRERLLASLAPSSGAPSRHDELVSLEPSVPSRTGAPSAAEELAILRDPSVSERWIDAVEALRARRGLVVPDDALGAMLRAGPTVLEGAQGVLLDERHGFHPHTTWSDCTTAAASALLRRHGVDDGIERIGVLRTYLTRHGEGPFPSEAPALAAHLPEPHNASDGWQGAFRVGHQDMVLLRYALRVSGGVDVLALTHTDRLAAVSSLVTAYEGAADATLFMHDAHGRAIDLYPQQEEADQERLGRALRDVRVVRAHVAPDAESFAARITEELGVPVAITSAGPTAADKREPTRRPAR
ncbi:MAG: adenylosuccinate synthetase [Labilithrix sp.]|nr:adenylosuccinate synthetase [Labilithrix sp.]MCW5812481.1 adenylosuccinate synthetase [Labilithrix sp.]